ncbi:FAD/NAD(P)-binding domain-containing protein [Sphaerulina musiva SO2202]|uniref:FAD/NAD(P)-binding domain-containing protein n=1 Tax=Sphaerulina musiva (strain SO2202) TaxID=692275 RepID=M3D0R3_SPHMS|nr:FAD/NAD(P)-binding domain-containing protein [Sphaerulina musiva SO2202]EMF10073.1 FAD/NAD(P)-binding domain-containing protein [Sphaerulina musiva SO2202]
MPPPRVAVIGAGPCGLVALKTLKEDGFDVILYERRDYVGGLWKYSTDDSISVADNTEFNSSKFRSALSDFPMPDDMADFPTAKQLYKYFCDYCTHFGLWEHIKLGHEVKKMQFLRATDSKTSGGLDYKVSFEKVAVATGPWTRPRPLKFPGLDQFKGRIVHSMHFHDPASYTGNVLVVGMSASAQDIVSALPGHASKVYLSHKSGVVLIPRYTRDGSTWDHGPTLNQTVWLAWLFTWLPKRYYEYLDGRLQRLSKWAYPNIPPSWNLSPPPSSAVAPPLVAAQLWPHLQSGFCELVPEVAGVCGDTVKLSSGGMHGTYRETLHEIDHIINCTGYDPDVPIIFDPPDAHPYPPSHNSFKPKFYHNTIPMHPDPELRTSLALLGHGTIFHSGFVRWEISSWAISQLWQGNSAMPSLREMEEWHARRVVWRDGVMREYGRKSTFFDMYLPFTDHVDWLDRTAGCGLREHFGIWERWINISAWKFWYQDRKFYNTCCHGLTSPAIFKLFDMGKRKPWKDAKRQILLDNSLAEEAAAERRRRLGKKEMQTQTQKQKQQGPTAANGGDGDGGGGDGCVVEGMKMGS